MRALVEICAEGIASALAAGAGGADRVELCENLAIGGVTPGAGSIAVVAEKLSIPVHVLIRPRGGDFVYSTDELTAMKRDVQAAKGLGASGVVFGFLTLDGKVDMERVAWLMEAAYPLSTTFHKAFDATRDPSEALDHLISLGVSRVLTSGSAATAWEGRETLTGLVRQASGRIGILAGGRIELGQIRPMIEAGLSEIHLGSAAMLGGLTDPGLVGRIVATASMAEIYHITTRVDWDRAIALGRYEAESLATEGFIHSSTSRQVEGSANRFFSGCSEVLILRIATGLVEVPIERANSPHSPDPFPHVHGPINLDAVVEVVPIEPDGSGRFRWPS